MVHKIKGRDHRIKLGAYDKRTKKNPMIRDEALSVYTNLVAMLEEKSTKTCRTMPLVQATGAPDIRL
ncbi:hypothetical protein PMHK_33150 [Pseudomonas sp. MHK4]